MTNPTADAIRSLANDLRVNPTRRVEVVTKLEKLADKVENDRPGFTAEYADDMVEQALTEWLRYNDCGNFHYIVDSETVTVWDGDENARLTFTFEDFAKAHYDLMYKRGAAELVGSQVYDWFQDAEDYDAISCDCTLQIMLYGKLVYG